MKIKINNETLVLQEGDSVEVHHEECSECGQHQLIEVERNNETIARFGSEISLSHYRGEELFGGVVLNSKGEPVPDKPWVVHINDGYDTPERMHYKTLCGHIFSSNCYDHDRDHQIFRSQIQTMSQEEKERLCPECEKKI